MQLDQSDFDDMFACNDSFENSLAIEKVKDGKIIKPHTDTSSFVAGFQCERSGADDIFFDGIDSHNALVSIQLFGAPADPGHDVYVNPTEGPTPVPILFTLQEAIWAFNSVRGGICNYFVTYDSTKMFQIATVDKSSS
jgi:hypothetical protein